jgi:hypothetical protein
MAQATLTISFLALAALIHFQRAAQGQTLSTFHIRCSVGSLSGVGVLENAVQATSLCLCCGSGTEARASLLITAGAAPSSDVPASAGAGRQVAGTKMAACLPCAPGQQSPPGTDAGCCFNVTPTSTGLPLLFVVSLVCGKLARLRKHYHLLRVLCHTSYDHCYICIASSSAVVGALVCCHYVYWCNPFEKRS